MTSTMASSPSAAPPQASQPDPLPSAWDATARGPSMRYLEITGARVRYRGPGSDDRDAAAVRANHPVPTHCPIFYYEIEVINRGRDGFIGIGFSIADVKLDRLPGWEPHSYGYHGDDGHVFNGKGTGRQYGPCFGTGDWIGVVLNRIEGTISFVKNGIELGIAFDNVPASESLYPTVGFRTPEEEISANFGETAQHGQSKPFRGDYAAIRAEAAAALAARVLATQIPRQKKGQDVVGDLVFDYLTHHGHWKTAAAVARDVLGGAAEVSNAAREEATALSGVAEALLRGDVDASAAAAERLAPGVLESHPRVGFALRCQKMCELIKAGRDEEAMLYGRNEVAPACAHPADRELLDEAVTLFAYPEPATSPAGSLLSQERRGELAAAVQRAIRAALGRREVSALEDVYRQAVAVHEELKAMGAPVASLIELAEVVENGHEMEED